MIDDSGLELNDAFVAAFTRLENTAENIFVTGKAGTGKSTLLQYFRNRTKKKSAVLAPTGVAAVNVSGQTIHSFFRFKPDITPDTVPLIRLRKSQRKIYENLECLIIDEISMVRADILDCIDAFLRLHGRRKYEPFGGVQMIFFGDLFQLPPVVTRADEPIMRQFYEGPYFFNAQSYGYLKLQIVELEKIYRQKEEKFVHLLNAIRDNDITAEQVKELNSRHQPQFMPDEGTMHIYLTTTNKLADDINQNRLKRLKTRPFYFEGEIDGQFQERVLPTSLELHVKYDAQVMLLNNDPEGRWINGSIGKIISVDDLADMIRVELATGERVDVTPFTWEMFKFTYDEETRTIESEVTGSFRQFPLKLAWAVTIHKAQGQTFENVILDIGGGTFVHGQAYVALSRCTNFEGLVLRRPIHKSHILLDTRVVDFMRAQKEDHSVAVLDIVDAPQEKLSAKERMKKQALDNVRNVIAERNN